MNGEKLFEHLENLVPGLVTLACLAWKIPPAAQVFPNPILQKLAEQSFIAGATVVAVAYLVGVLVFIVSRLIVNTLSALTLRPVLLKLYVWPEFNFNPWLNNQKYRQALDSARRQPEKSYTRQEVARRRQRGRLIRTLLIPMIIILWPFGNGGLAAGCVLAILFVYSYSEVCIYQEARLAKS